MHEAARWYKRAYRNGSRTGALNLAVDLEKQGKMRTAVIWLKRAIAMNEGDAFLRLAKIYMKRPKGSRVAAALLKKAISLTRDDISDDSKVEAELLLRRIEKTPN